MEKVTTTIENANAVLNQYGVAVIPSIITPEDCETLFNKMWDFFEQITADMPNKINRNDESTWNTLLDLFPSHGMLFQHWGIGHAEFAWWIRQHPAVVGAFARLWNVEPDELLVSFDGASFQAPPDRAGNPTPKRGWGSPKPWYHSDQSLKRNNRECIQGWVTAKTVKEGDSTLAVMTGSHLLHREVAAKFPALIKPADWVQFDPNVISFFAEKGCEPLRISCPAGSLVLWDSRTAHYGAPPIAGRSTPEFRAVTYVCYMPRYGANLKRLQLKRTHYMTKRTTSHWPGKSRAFSLKPRTYGVKDLPLVVPAAEPSVSELGKKLAGF
jgi:hypothetical protein